MAPIASQLLLATLTGSALAAVSHHQRHAALHKRQTSSSVAVPYGTNSTGKYYSATATVKYIHTEVKQVKQTKTVYVTEGAVSSPAAPAIVNKDYNAAAAAPAAAYHAPGSNQGDNCPKVVTVTATAVNTVTVTAGQSTAPSTTPAVVAQAAGKDAQHGPGHYGGYGNPSQHTSSSSPVAPVAPTTKAYSPAPYSAPAAPTTSKSSAAASQPSTPAVCKRGVSAKKGCAAFKTSRDNCQTLNNGGAGMSWIYDWEAGESDLDDMEYVPMLHGVDGSWMEWFTTSSAVKSAKFAMLPNEPMIAGQAATGRTVDQSEIENLYPQFKAALGSNTQILSPSICGNQDGINWLKAFNNDMYHIINAHYYEDCTSQQGADGLNAYLSSVKSDLPGKQIWVTELGCHPGASQDQIQQFMVNALKAVESDSTVDRYSWYKADGTDDMSQGWLTNGDNSPSVYGDTYASAGCA